MTDDMRFRPGLSYLEDRAARRSKDSDAEARSSSSFADLKTLKRYWLTWLVVLVLATIGFLAAFHFS
jgi:hypothetical protein